jgi:hypothetical protein
MEAATRGSSAAAASALPPPREDSERRHSIGVDAGQRAGKPNRCAPVNELALRLEEVRLSSAVTEAAVIEDESSDACGRKALRERPQPVAASSGQSVSHDDDRLKICANRRRVEPGGADIAA